MDTLTLEIKPTLPSDIIMCGRQFYMLNNSDGTWQKVDPNTVMLAIEKAGFSTKKPQKGILSPAKEALLTLKIQCQVKKVLEWKVGFEPGVHRINNIKSLVLEPAPEPSAAGQGAECSEVEKLLQDMRKELVAPEVCYHNTKHMFMLKAPNGQWLELSHSDLQGQLQARVRIPKEDDEGRFDTKVQETINQIMRETQLERTIELACEVAGWKAGIHDYNGCRFLVKRGLMLPQPVPGNCVELRAFFESLLPDGQVHYYYGWLKHALEGLYNNNRRYGKAVILTGPPDCGKTLCREITTEIMGGRAGKPHSFMQGDTSFNADLVASELWCIDDENSADTSHWDRRKFGSRIKTVTADKTMRVHPKGQQAFVLPVHVRLMICSNSESQNLLIIPPMDDSLKDKILIFKCAQALIPTPPAGVNAAAWQLMDQVFKPQIPAFVHWLLNDYVLPEELMNTRYGVAAYQHVEVQEELFAKSREGILLELIDKASPVYLSSSAVTVNAVIRNTATGATRNTVISVWRGTSMDLSAILCDHSHTTSGEAKKILDWADGCGTYLGNLKNDLEHGWRFKSYRSKTSRSWGIVLKPTLSDDEVVNSIAWPA